MKIYCDGSKKKFKISLEGRIEKLFNNLENEWTTNQSEMFAILFASLFYAHYEDEIISDSEWAIREINKEYKLRDEKYRKWLEVIWELKEKKNLKFSWINRENNLGSV